jgi:hypothetical protein
MIFKFHFESCIRSRANFCKHMLACWRGCCVLCRNVVGCGPLSIVACPCFKEADLSAAPTKLHQLRVTMETLRPAAVSTEIRSESTTLPLSAAVFIAVTCSHSARTCLLAVADVSQYWLLTCGYKKNNELNFGKSINTASDSCVYENNFVPVTLIYFIYERFTDAVSSSNYILQRTVDWKGYRRKRSLPNLLHIVT